MKQQVKKNMVGIAVAAFLLLICIVISFIPKDRKYDNLQHALAEDKVFYGADILETIESNGVVDVFYLANDMQLRNQIVLVNPYCRVLDRVVFPDKQISVHDYIIVYQKYKNKHCISITSTKENALKESVRDNQDSEFAFFQYIYPEQFSLQISN